MNRRKILTSAIAISGVAILGGGAYYFTKSANIPESKKFLDLIPLKAVKNEKNQNILNLTISEIIIDNFGDNTKIFSFNNQYPAPMIELNAGETYFVHIKNLLPEATNIHWHGLDVDPIYDGNPDILIAPNTESTIILTIPDDASGLYWYHPHPHHKTSQHVARGLAGALVVREKNSPISDDIIEKILIITDISLQNGQIALSASMIDTANGREGQYILVNGQLNPVLDFPQNSNVRFRIINACASRYLSLNFIDENPKNHAKITQIGTDGGYLEKPVVINEIFLSPAERIDVIVEFSGDITSKFKLKNRLYDRGLMGGKIAKNYDMPICQVNFTNEIAKNSIIPEKLTTITPLPKANKSAKITLGESMIMNHANMASMNHANMADMTMSFLINGKPFDINRVDFEFNAHDIILFEIINPTDMDHPIHFHGGQFQVLASNFNEQTTPAAFLAWKDTMNIRKGEIITLAMQQKTKGLKMVHCHILDHEDNGMMATIKIL